MRFIFVFILRASHALRFVHKIKCSQRLIYAHEITNEMTTVGCVGVCVCVQCTLYNVHDVVTAVVSSISTGEYNCIFGGSDVGCTRQSATVHSCTIASWMLSMLGVYFSRFVAMCTTKKKKNNKRLWQSLPYIWHSFAFCHFCRESVY